MRYQHDSSHRELEQGEMPTARMVETRWMESPTCWLQTVRHATKFPGGQIKKSPESRRSACPLLGHPQCGAFVSVATHAGRLSGAHTADPGLGRPSGL